MSAVDFVINLGQEKHLGNHDEQIAELRAIVYNLHKWVVHLNSELEKVKNENTQTNQTTVQSDLETQRAERSQDLSQTVKEVV